MQPGFSADGLSLARLAQTVREVLAREGVAHFQGTMTRRRFFALAEKLGVVWDQLLVFPDPRRRVYVRNPGRVPFHNDSVHANLIGWYCVRPCSSRVSNRFLDARHALAQLGEKDRRLVAKLRCRDPLQQGDVVAKLGRWVRVVDERGGEPKIFWIAHRTEVPRGRAARNATLRFAKLLAGERGSRVVRVRLERGQFVLIDNNRFLHGREPIPADSPRLLYRLWINTDEWPGAEAHRVRAPMPIGPRKRR